MAKRVSATAKQAIREYVELQSDEKVVHLEHVASERVGPQRHDIWDVHCSGSRWWVVTNPTNLYSQTDFKSRDVVLTFHIGLTIRISYNQEREVPVAPEPALLLPGSWRRWQQAFETFESGDEAENFQSVGVRLRECLVSFVGEVRRDEMVPPSDTAPKASDVKGWANLVADSIAGGATSASLRSYLKKVTAETWDYTNWLTHAKNAVRLDAEIGLQAVQHLLGTFTAAQMRQRPVFKRCDRCKSYLVVAGRCEHCEWVDPEYKTPLLPSLTSRQRRRRLSKHCTPSSDISTFMGPDDVI